MSVDSMNNLRPLTAVYMPTGAHPGLPQGVILGLCGLLESGEAMQSYSGINEGIAEKINCVAVYPNAIAKNWIERPNDWADKDTNYLNSVIANYHPALDRRFAIGCSDGACKLLTDSDRLNLDRLVIYAGFPMGLREMQPVGVMNPKRRFLFIRGADDGFVHLTKVQEGMRVAKEAGHDVDPLFIASGGHLVDRHFNFDPATLPVIVEFFTRN